MGSATHLSITRGQLSSSCGLLFSASGVSLMTDFDLVDTQELISSRSCTVFYLSVDGASVMRSEIGSEHVPEQVYELEPDSRHDRLFIRSDEESL